MLRQRMYHLVIYQLSGIQAGIQAGHAKDIYALRYPHSREYKQWLTFDKTVIILNGGTTNQQGEDWYSKAPYKGSLDIALSSLNLADIPNAPFYEPDLNNAMTAVAFLVDEKVWDKEQYPSYELEEGKKVFFSDAQLKKLYKLTDKQLFLRKFLKEFDLARN